MSSPTEPRWMSNTLPASGPREMHSVWQSLDREPRQDLLGGRAENFDVYKYSLPFTVVRRQPMVQSPRSTSRHNYGLLPNVEDMDGMELAYRHESMTPSEAAATARAKVIGFYFLGLLLPAAVVTFGQILPLQYVGMLASAASLLWIIYLVVTRSATPRRLLVAFLTPLAVLVFALVSFYVFRTRLVGSAVAAVAAYYAVRRYWRAPFDHYTQWVYTHPRLRPETRRKAPRVVPPDFRLLAIVLACAVLIPVLSTSVALLAIAVICGLRLFRFPQWRLLGPEGLGILGAFLTYGGYETLAPGVWRPRLSTGDRTRRAALLFGPFFFALTLGLNYYLSITWFSSWSYLTSRFPDAPFYAMYDMMLARSESPLLVTWHMLLRLPAFREYSVLVHIAVALAFACTLPPLVLVTVFRRPLAAARRLRRQVEGSRTPTGEWEPGIDDDGRVEWQWYVDRVRTSSHVAANPLGDELREAEHLFLGVEPHARFPVLLDKQILAEHAYMVGDSGSGKTSLGLMPLLIQLIRGHHDENHKLTPCPPIVVIDLKGDMALFETVRQEAEDRKAEFRFFTPQKGDASHYFNPFQSLESKNRTEIQLAQILLDALSLNHGEGYGRSYYSRQSREALLEVLSAKKKPRSIAELYEAIQKLQVGGETKYKDTLELASTVHALSMYKPLAVRTSPKRPEAAIHMPSVLEHGQVVYFWLPSAVESASTREIGKLALYCLLTACIDRARATPAAARKAQAYLFIDEFQRLAGENFQVVLQQARSFGLGVTLSHQSVSDLRTPVIDLRPTVRTNTRLKRYFSVTDPQEVSTLSEQSGEELMFLRSWSVEAGGPYTEHVASAYDRRSEAQSIKNRLTRNDIMAISDHPLDSVLHVSRGSGYTQFAGLPIPLRSTWAMSRAIYTARRDAAWPKRDDYEDGTIVVNDRSPLEIEHARDQETMVKAFEAMQSLNANRS